MFKDIKFKKGGVMKYLIIICLLLITLSVQAQYDPDVPAYVLHWTDCTDMSVNADAFKLKGDTLHLAFDTGAGTPFPGWHAHSLPIQTDTIPNTPGLWINGEARFSTTINAGGAKLIQIAMGYDVVGYPESTSKILVIKALPYINIIIR